MMKQLKPQNVCPECGHQFRGDGFDGIDAHWRAKHENLMPYRVAWPLIQSGTYRRRTGSIEYFSGCFAQEGGPRFTIAQIKKFTEDAWAGKR
jgi:hypothetical protein